MQTEGGETVVIAPARLVGLDRLRGLAVALMILDHAILAAGAASWLRLGPTRASLPLFCLVAGSLQARRGVGVLRCVELAVVGLVMTVALDPLVGIGTPDIVVLLGIALLVFELAKDNEYLVLTVAAVAVIQPFTWPVETNGGYQIGTVVALVYLGRHKALALAAQGERVPRCFEWLGRHALGVYVVHIATLGVVVAGLVQVGLR